MRTQTTGRCLLRFTAEAAVLVVALAAASTQAQLPDRGRRLDGSSPAALETSVALLQNDVRGRRREELDVALAMIWMNRTASSGDVDGDGDFDVDDIRQLEIDATALLTEIRRGNLVSAIEEREDAGGDYTAADYFAQLDGLGYDEILSLAGRPTEDGYLDAVREARRQLACSSSAPAFATSSTSRASRRAPDNCSGRTLKAEVGKALNAAIEALNARRYAGARAEISKLRFDRLTPYERSTAEQILSTISEAEGDLVAVREHLLNALAARGLNPEEARTVLNQIRYIDSRLSANPE